MSTWYDNRSHVDVVNSKLFTLMMVSISHSFQIGTYFSFQNQFLDKHWNGRNKWFGPLVIFHDSHRITKYFTIFGQKFYERQGVARHLICH